MNYAAGPGGIGMNFAGGPGAIGMNYTVGPGGIGMNYAGGPGGNCILDVTLLIMQVEFLHVKI